MPPRLFKPAFIAVALACSPAAARETETTFEKETACIQAIMEGAKDEATLCRGVAGHVIIGARLKKLEAESQKDAWKPPRDEPVHIPLPPPVFHVPK